MTSRAHMAEIFMRGLYPLLLIASAVILFRGHNAPGGGFIGGLMAVAASASYALVFNATNALNRLPCTPVRLAGLGILLALLSGVPAIIQGLPYLTHPWWTITVFQVELAASTVMLFDLGVYLAVWGTIGGSCLLLIHSIEEEA